MSDEERRALVADVRNALQPVSSLLEAIEVMDFGGSDVNVEFDRDQIDDANRGMEKTLGLLKQLWGE